MDEKFVVIMECEGGCQMRWTVLGCHSPYPAPGGGTPGYLLEAEGKKILIDCGSGTLARLAGRVAVEALDAVLLSHLHHDHLVDFFVLQYAVMTARKQGKRKHPLAVWSPEKPAGWFEKLRYKTEIERSGIREGLKIHLGGRLTVHFFRTDHAVPCFAMRIHDGQHTILYGADSGPETDWGKMGESPDLFVCEASFLHKDLPDQPTGHLSARQAGLAAARLKAKQLILTHLYPGYDPDQLKEEAMAVFDGVCQTAYSGMTIDL
jgi:ribonuclease BN (tRNA processing enzyme)